MDFEELFKEVKAAHPGAKKVGFIGEFGIYLCEPMAWLGADLVLLPTFFTPVLFPLFKLSEGATEVAVYMAITYAVFMPTRAFDVTNITGVLRAGGDAKMASVIDIVPLWCVAIPVMALTALVLDAPIWLVCVAMSGENFIKCPLGLIRFHSKKWINDITRAAA